MLRRSPHDKDILRLALPALGALAAEPLYVLVDTAMVGHLGTPQLAALALAGTLLTGAFTLFNFLTYGTTAQVARLHGAGQEERAGRIAAQALWLSLAIGVALLAVLGMPFALIALAGTGYLRGVADLRTPLIIVVAANVANVALQVVFLYVLHWGLNGSAWATVIAQAGMGVAFVVCLLRAPADSR